LPTPPTISSQRIDRRSLTPADGDPALFPALRQTDCPKCECPLY
jgi:hypothetical protein